MSETIKVAGMTIVVNETIPEGEVWVCDAPVTEKRIEGRDLIITQRFRVRTVLNHGIDSHLEKVVP